ncbi:MAG: hypothetical protein RR365_02205 [Bacteroides sp.]
MTFEQARNAIVCGLETHIGQPVNLSEQIAEIPVFPYCYYSVLAPRISNHSFGLQEVLVTEDGHKLIRSEPVMATMSFTFCSANREIDVGYIFGEDEALELSEKAHGFFLLNAHNISTEYGDVVINNIGSIANRTGFFVTDAVRRYGFDIRFSYVRTDEMPTITVSKPGNSVGNTYS